MREIVLDTESTGLDPKSGHRLVEIGCLELMNHVPTGNVFHCYINPERDMPQEAFNVHGLSEEFLRDHPVFKDVAEKFLEFIQDDILVIHNARFDMKFLNHELGSLEIVPLSFERVIDTLQIAREKFPGSPANLDALCRRFNVDNSTRVKHGALLDAELLAEVYLELIGGRQSTFHLEEEAQHVLSKVDGYTQNVRPIRSFPASEEELKNHKEILGKISNALWNSF